MTESARQEVVHRAAGRCEYCHLPEAHVLTPFQIEHVIAKQHRGRDTADNLAYACLRCNSFKGSDIAGRDGTTKQLTPLFNPRRHRWARHFRWQGPCIVGRTPIGRVTVAVLNMNGEFLVRLREELMKDGLFPSATAR